MKMLKKAIYLLLAGTTALTMICAGTVTAEAKLSSTLLVNGEITADGYYFIHLKGLSDKEFSAAGDLAVKNGGTWCAILSFEISDGEYHMLTQCDKYTSGTDQAYFLSGAVFDSKNNTYLAPAFAYYISKTVNKTLDISGSEWDIYFSVTEDIYNILSKSTVVRVGFGANINSEMLDPDGSAMTYQYANQTWQTTSSSFSSSAKNFSTLAFSSISSQTYSGKAKTPDVKIKDGDYTLKKGTDYTLSYKNNKNIGEATVTITGKGKYSGTKTVNFKIVPGKTALTVKKSDEKYTFRWGKVSVADKYQIYYSDDGNTYKKLAAVSGSKTSYSTKKLDADKNYYFKIRSYKTVDGTKYYSKYSKVVKK